MYSYKSSPHDQKCVEHNFMHGKYVEKLHIHRHGFIKLYKVERMKIRTLRKFNSRIHKR